MHQLLTAKENNEKDPFYLYEKFYKVIQPGIDYPNTKIPFIATDKSDYKLFKDIFIDFIRLYHGVDVIKNKAEKETFPLIKSFLFILDEDIISKYFIEIDITTHRNINGFDFPASITSLKRKELKEIIKNTIEEIEPEVFRRVKNFKLKNEINQSQFKEAEEPYIEKENYSKGRFALITNNSDLKDNYVNKNPMLKSAGIFRDWPEDRLIYFNLDDNFLCLINEEDHLKVKLNTNEVAKISDNLVLYFDFLEKLENNFSFAYDNEIGYLNSIPINSGASTFFSVKLKIPKSQENFIKIVDALEESANDLNLNLNKNEGNDDFSILTITNKSPYYSFANLLIDIIKFKDFLK